jgi:hypothetical protein
MLSRVYDTVYKYDIREGIQPEVLMNFDLGLDVAKVVVEVAE